MEDKSLCSYMLKLNFCVFTRWKGQEVIASSIFSLLSSLDKAACDNNACYRVAALWHFFSLRRVM